MPRGRRRQGERDAQAKDALSEARELLALSAEEVRGWSVNRLLTAISRFEEVSVALQAAAPLAARLREAARRIVAADELRSRVRAEAARERVVLSWFARLARRGLGRDFSAKLSMIDAELAPDTAVFYRISTADQTQLLKAGLIAEGYYSWGPSDAHAYVDLGSDVPTRLATLAKACERAEQCLDAKQAASDARAELKARRARRKVQKAQERDAHAAAYLGKQRSLAETIKRHLAEQREKNKWCPYCFGPLGDEPHADHIHPVALGGLSTLGNMVYVCADCNGDKRDRTLREFIVLRGLDRERIERALESLGKKF